MHNMVTRGGQGGVQSVRQRVGGWVGGQQCVKMDSLNALKDLQ